MLHDVYSLVKTRIDANAAYAITSQILFLRFFCPALAAPESYQLLEVAPSMKAHRALVLISYSLKHLTSGSLFKESNMAEMNTFIKDNQQIMQEFVNKICVSPPALVVVVVVVFFNFPLFSIGNWSPSKQYHGTLGQF